MAKKIIRYFKPVQLISVDISLSLGVWHMEPELYHSPRLLWGSERKMLSLPLLLLSNKFP